MVVEEENKVDLNIIDPIWIVTKVEGMVIKGINIPKKLQVNINPCKYIPRLDFMSTKVRYCRKN
jgi:hypothetical protein